MKIDDPDVLAEVNAAFNAYETALITNEIDMLDRLFWHDDRTLRFGAGENLVGIGEIRDFRNSRPGKGLTREITGRHVTTFGDAFAVANITFRRNGEARIGRQTQTWTKMPEGWRVVAAHVSWMDG